MTAAAAAFGLKPSYHPSGVIRPDKGTIVSTYASNIFQGSPVRYLTGGGLGLAAAGERAAGAFQGVEYNPPGNLPRIISNYWPAAAVGTNIVAYLTTDPDIVYEIQSNATLAISAIGRTYDWSANASANGNTSTGNSSVALDAASVATPNAGLIVMGLLETLDNAWDDAFPVVLVKIAEPQFGAAIPSIY